MAAAAVNDAAGWAIWLGEWKAVGSFCQGKLTLAQKLGDER
jgi:hypothetical protein